MSQIVIIGQFDIEAEDVSAAAELMRTMMNETVKEPGCRHYAFSTHLSVPNRFQLSELWDDDAALASHFRTPHMEAFRAGLAKLRVLQRTVQRYQVTNTADL